MGFDNRTPIGGGLSPINLAVQYIQHERSVAYVGPYAGRRRGLINEQGRPILVTEGYNLPMPAVGGDFPLIRAITTGMLDWGKIPQSGYFFAWLKWSYESLASGELNPAHVLAFVGPRSCGKSLLQTLICKVLGGRSANPFAWMTGQTPFNRELFGVENLMFGDEISGNPDIRTRRKFGTIIKQIAVNEDQRCHGKNREALTLRPFWRATFSINDEPENVVTIPPLDDSMQDKLIIFKIQRPGIFDTSAWGKVRSENMRNLVAEIPYFLDFLKKFQVPIELQGDRCGVANFQHPDIMVALNAMSQEERLLELIDDELFPNDATAGSGPFVGKASKVERALLRRESSSRESASKLLYFSGAVGTYLARLADREDGRVTFTTGRGGTREYTIHPPPHRASGAAATGDPGIRVVIRPGARVQKSTETDKP